MSAPTASPPDVPPGVPDYVVKHAPLVYLYSKEEYLPSDIGTQLAHTVPCDGATPLPSAQIPQTLTLSNLNKLNEFADKGTNVFLKSRDDITTHPEWLRGIKPDEAGKVHGAKTCCVIVVDKGNGIVDAFWMFFYAYNFGGIVLKMNFDDHVGDWEHVMIRFKNGVPTVVWYSQHATGQAFKYEVVLKDEAKLRPLAFCATGSHAHYATPGVHDHTIPSDHHKFEGILNDYTDHGPLYDPLYSSYWYSWTAPPAGAKDVASLGTFVAYDQAQPVEWLYFQGQWGDQRYPKTDPRQTNFLEFYKYESGPNGPAFKDLGRKDPWSGSNKVVLGKLGP